MWNTALNNPMLECDIYLDNLFRKVFSNRNGILDGLKEHFDIFNNTGSSDSDTLKAKLSPEKNSETKIEHDISDCCKDQNPHNCDEIVFNISLTDAEWVTFKPTDRMWGKKMFLHLL